MKIFIVLLTAVFFFALSTQPAYAEGRIRERIKQKIVEKLEDAPAVAANASITDKIVKPGDYYFSIVHDKLTRMYRVHVPPGYSPSIPASLLLALHGGGGDMDYMASDEHYGLIKKSDREGFVIVFPNGYSKFKSGKLATWNAGTCCGDARDKNIDDVGFIKQVIKNITHQMVIDPNKIFSTGMSNGGLMSYRLACEMSDTFKAIASVAGTDNTLECTPKNPVSILHMHAKNDTHVLFDGGAGQDSFKDPTKVTDFISVAATFAKWTGLNRCTGIPKRVLDITGAYCDLYDQCNGQSTVKLCVTTSGGHSWPGSAITRGEPSSKAISANDMMWNFFKNSQ